ncbi:MAG: hypothetical protein ABS36_09220 [Acidobacteria bacterium SCN 69-37]|nr:MAG: hypothetical protein ABS36_09220 [Acidobacteria bacterium SCN 69-37]
MRSISVLLLAGLWAWPAPGLAGQLAATASGAASARLAVHAAAVPAGADPMRIDGVFDEPVWQAAPPIDTFVQREPDEGASTTHATVVRVAYDADALFVAVQARDPEPDAIVGHLTRRDDRSPSDWIAVLIDSFNDKRTAYEFAVNVAGVQYDRYWYNDTNNDEGWDAVWDAAVRRTTDGWQAEFRIGFSQLRFRGRDIEAIGFAAMRTVAHTNETSTWPLLARSASGFVSSFGELNGLQIDAPARALEVMPYAVARMTTTPAAPGNPFVSSPAGAFSAGVDVKYQVAPGLTLTGTINPDFGQVEADPAVVNLGAFETFFSERRPFFLEGAGTFQFRNLFYSRRIGRAPQRQVAAPEDGFADQPSNTTILGAAKLTGRIGAFAVGALTAVTGAEQARLASANDGPRTRTPVEPVTSYSVVRITREFADQSRLSVMATNTTRRLPDDLTFLPSSAVTGGADGDLRFGPSGHYSLQGFWAGSQVRGDATAIDRLQRSTVHSFQRPDASHLRYDPLRTALGGHSGGASFGKIGGAHVVFNVNAGYRSPGFDINDLGFQERADQTWAESWIQFKDETPGRFFRTFRFNINQWAGWTFGGDRRNLGFNVNAHWRTIGNWGFGSGGTRELEHFDDRLTRGGPGGLAPGVASAWAYIETDDRKPLSMYVEQGVYSDGNGSHDSSQWFRTTLRPTSALTVGVELDVSHQRTARQWVTNRQGADGTQYVFGAIDRMTIGVGTRVNYTVSPSLSVQIYARPFVSAGAYESFAELVAPRAAADADRYRAIAYDGHPDFNVRAFRTTNVLRWEYRPGSTLFVVWQQGRDGVSPHGDFSLGRDLRRVFDAPAENVFLVKVSRWLDF